MADFEPFAGMAQEQTLKELRDGNALMRKIVKLLEASGNADVANRQRVVVDAQTGNLNVVFPAAQPVSVASAAITTLAGLDQRQFDNPARSAYATGIRQNLRFG